jgi:pilus assembly protein CpaF
LRPELSVQIAPSAPSPPAAVPERRGAPSRDASGPVASGPVTSGPVAPDPHASHPVVPGPAASGRVTPGRPDPATRIAPHNRRISPERSRPARGAGPRGDTRPTRRSEPVGPTAVSPALVEAVRVRLARAGVEPSAAHVMVALRAERAVLGDAEILAVARELSADLIGAGPLEPLLAAPDVTDVLVNGPSEVWVDDGQGLRRTDVTFPDDDAVRRLAQRLAAAAGRRLDDALPYVDARLAGGVRLHAVLPPLAAGGTCVSLRLPPRRTFTLPELVTAGTVPVQAVGVLRALIDARLAFLVTGGTGTGKTTLLSALLSLVDARERLLLVEDSAELRPDHPHVVRLEARPANLEGAGGVGLRDLVRQALRMRPDRLVVGEVRGQEVVTLLAALNTGHEGGCGTLHANAAADVPPRLEALACAAGLRREAVHSQLAAALDAVVHLVRDRPGGRRRIAEISVLARRATGLVEAEPALTIRADGTVLRGPGHSRLAQRLSEVLPAPQFFPEGHAGLCPETATSVPFLPQEVR